MIDEGEPAHGGWTRCEGFRTRIDASRNWPACIGSTVAAVTLPGSVAADVCLDVTRHRPEPKPAGGAPAGVRAARHRTGAAFSRGSACCCRARPTAGVHSRIPTWRSTIQLMSRAQGITHGARRLTGHRARTSRASRRDTAGDGRSGEQEHRLLALPALGPALLANPACDGRRRSVARPNDHGKSRSAYNA